MKRATQEVVVKFYEAFKVRDGASMAAAYAANAHFSDPVFPDLNGQEVGNMWKMLTAGENKDFSIRDVEVTPFDEEGHRYKAQWTAHYVFNGNPVVNRVTSVIELDADGKIVEQKDTFDFELWQSQALGWVGSWFGWTGFPGWMTQKKAAERLAAYQAKNSQ